MFEEVIWQGTQFGITTTIDIDPLGCLVIKQDDEEGSAVGIFVEQLPGIVAALTEIIDKLGPKPDTL